MIRSLTQLAYSPVQSLSEPPLSLLLWLGMEKEVRRIRKYSIIDISVFQCGMSILVCAIQDENASEQNGEPNDSAQANCHVQSWEQMPN